MNAERLAYEWVIVTNWLANREARCEEMRVAGLHTTNAENAALITAAAEQVRIDRNADSSRGNHYPPNPSKKANQPMNNKTENELIVSISNELSNCPICAKPGCGGEDFPCEFLADRAAYWAQVWLASDTAPRTG